MPSRTRPSLTRAESSRSAPPAAHRQMPAVGRSKTRRLAYERLILHTHALSFEGAGPYAEAEQVVPEAWATLEQDVDVWEPKVKVTLRLDESVAKFYRAMGPGYQARVSRILATYAQMRIAEVREGEAALARFQEEMREGLGNAG